MKRNILLLTAVVLAAVLMTGCIGPLAKVKLTVDPITVKEGDKTFVVATVGKLVEKGYSKNALAEIEVRFVAKDKEGKVPDGQKEFPEGKTIEFKFDPTTTKAFVEEAVDADGDLIGYDIAVYMEKAVKITGEVKDKQVQP